MEYCVLTARTYGWLHLPMKTGKVICYDSQQKIIHYWMDNMKMTDKNYDELCDLYSLYQKNDEAYILDIAHILYDSLELYDWDKNCPHTDWLDVKTWLTFDATFVSTIKDRKYKGEMSLTTEVKAYVRKMHPTGIVFVDTDNIKFETRIVNTKYRGLCGAFQTVFTEAPAVEGDLRIKNKLLCTIKDVFRFQEEIFKNNTWYPEQRKKEV